MASKRTHYKCRVCGEQVSVEEAKLEEIVSSNNSVTKYRYHESCYEEMILRREDKKKFDKLYDYIRYDILKVQDGKSYKYLINRLQALRYGEYDSKIKKDTKAYTYEQMYYTFITCKKSIQDSIRLNEFKDEKHLVNYIMSIVLNSINDVCDRMERKQSNDDSLNGISNTISITNNQYVKKEKSNVGNLLKELI